jgi:hypothetical protein
LESYELARQQVRRPVHEKRLGGTKFTQMSQSGNQRDPEELLQECVKLLQEYRTGVASCGDAGVSGGRGGKGTTGESKLSSQKGLPPICKWWEEVTTGPGKRRVAGLEGQRPATDQQAPIHQSSPFKDGSVQGAIHGLTLTGTVAGKSYKLNLTPGAQSLSYPRHADQHRTDLASKYEFSPNSHWRPCSRPGLW